MRIVVMCALVAFQATHAFANSKQKTAAPKSETSLDVTPETAIPVELDDGKIISATINVGVNNAVHLSYDDAKRLKTNGSTIGTFDSHNKSVNQDLMVRLYSSKFMGRKRDIAYYWPRLRPTYDQRTQIGPEALGVDFLNVSLRPKREGEVTFGLKLIRFSKVYVGWNAGIGTLARIGDQTVSVMFDPSEDKSYALGTVGRRIAVHSGGYYIDEPEIPFESNRHAKYPDYRIRKMTFGAPAVLGNLGLNHIFILDSEGQDGKVIPGRERIDDNDPAFAIVVDAMKKEPRHKSYPTMVIGKDNLSQCSSIAFDFARELIYLSCLPNGMNSPIQLSPQGAYFPAKAE
jgi:hypothetical protein